MSTSNPADALARLEAREAELNSRLPELFAEAIIYDEDREGEDFFLRWSEKLLAVARQLSGAGYGQRIEQFKQDGYTFDEKIAGSVLWNALVPNCTATNLAKLLRMYSQHVDQIRTCWLRLRKKLWPEVQPVGRTGKPVDGQDPSAWGPVAAVESAGNHPNLSFAPGKFIYRKKGYTLKGKAWQVLKALAEARGHVLTAKELHDSIWRKEKKTVGDEAIKSQISKARKALKAAGANGDPIPNVGRGTQLLAWRLEIC